MIRRTIRESDTPPPPLTGSKFKVAKVVKRKGRRPVSLLAEGESSLLRLNSLKAPWKSIDFDYTREKCFECHQKSHISKKLKINANNSDEICFNSQIINETKSMRIQ